MFRRAERQSGGSESAAVETTLEHGGRLRRAAREYGIALERWLDLSTGINPDAWPPVAVPSRVWARLPEDEDGLVDAACGYYGAVSLLPVAGSQAAIQALPRLRQKSRVGMLPLSYAEHAQAWRRAGHEVVLLQSNEIEDQIKRLDVLLLVNPNNPTGERFASQQLLNWHRNLLSRRGWLVIDEAFIDVTPERSLARFSAEPGLIVLRSLGKFFGLAGVRVGFVLAEPTLLQQLASYLGPWALSGPSRFIAMAALRDERWQRATRVVLQQRSQRLATLLAQYELEADGGTALFQWLRHPQAVRLHRALAKEAILTRLFKASETGQPSLRFGLPKEMREWQRFEQALSRIAPFDRSERGEGQ